MTQDAGWFTVYDPNNDDNGMIHLNVTDEGLVIDVYDADGQLSKTWCATATEIAESFFNPEVALLRLVDPADLDPNAGVVYRCEDCGSTTIMQDAFVPVNDPKDVRLFDHILCDDCGSEHIAKEART